MTVVHQLFGDSNPIGSTMKINRINFTVIGVLPEKGSSGWNDQDDVVVVPVTTAMYRLLGKLYVDSIDAEVKRRLSHGHSAGLDQTNGNQAASFK